MSFSDTFLRLYFKLFHFVARKRLKFNDLDPRIIHVHLAVILTTGVVMWTYAILAWFTIDSLVLGIVGSVASFVHLFSPLLYRITRNTSLPVNILLTAGLVHQGTFAFYTGGFNSNILIWFGILPLIGGVCNGKKGAILWATITFTYSMIYFLMFLSGFDFPYLISETGAAWAQALLVFGWIFLSSAIVAVYSGLRESTETVLQGENKKIDSLFRVLFHDLANPLGRVSIGLTMAKKELPKNEKNRGLRIAESATNSMFEVTQNLKQIYSVQKGFTSIDLAFIDVNDAINYVIEFFTEILETKKISINYDFSRYNGARVKVEDVSFKNQVLCNIISNAIKFSAAGSVIEIEVRKKTTKQISILIKDFGIGIPKELLPDLFDIAKKTSRPGTHRESGSGFGLSIVKSFIEMYDGTIEVESREAPGKDTAGTVITLSLEGIWEEAP